MIFPAPLAILPRNTPMSGQLIPPWALPLPRPVVWARERRLIKLALAIGAGSEGAVHSHARRAKEEGIPDADLHQTAFLAIGPLGFPRAVASWTWIRDVTEPT